MSKMNEMLNKSLSSVLANIDLSEARLSGSCVDYSKACEANGWRPVRKTTAKGKREGQPAQLSVLVVNRSSGKRLDSAVGRLPAGVWYGLNVTIPFASLSAADQALVAKNTIAYAQARGEGKVTTEGNDESPDFVA